MIIVIIILLFDCRIRTMDFDMLLTILLCVIAAVLTLLSLFFFAKRKQKSYEEVVYNIVYVSLPLI